MSTMRYRIFLALIPNNPLAGNNRTAALLGPTRAVSLEPRLKNEAVREPVPSSRRECQEFKRIVE